VDESKGTEVIGVIAAHKKLDAILRTVEEIQDNMVDLNTQQEEIIEKINNLGLPGSGFHEEDYGHGV
jgi:hypothetical protein